MCTVTYLPKNKTDFILTSNRDEKVARQSIPPAEYLIGNKLIFFPKDPVSGGTWIARSQERLVCLLNGAFQKHTTNPPYKKSRGLVVLDYFSFENIELFKNQYSFSEIEPFTLIVIEEVKLFEFRWDGQNTHLLPLDRAKPYIWSSSTLYTSEIKERRAQWFQNWLSANSFYHSENIIDFHKTGGEGNAEIDFNMKRSNGIQTISVTSFEKCGTYFSFTYQDMISQASIQQKLVVC